MTMTSNPGDPDAVSTWHVRGAVGLLGCFAVLALATAVTTTLTFDAVLVLVGIGTGAGLAFLAMHQLGLAEGRRSPMLWPLALFCGIVALDPVVRQAEGLVMGLMVLTFLYIGLSQPPRSGLWLVLPAATLFLQVQDFDAAMTAVRLPIAILVCLICCEVPANLIKQLREKQAALELMASTDSLTGLLNRSTLDRQLERAGADGSVVMIDLDDFKQFNDQHGHVAGDVALMDFARMLRHEVRPGDAVFRYGGEEFLIVLEQVSLDCAETVIERVRTAWSPHASGLTFSAGVARAGVSGLRVADELLYRAKAEGRNRVIVESAAGPS